MSSNPSLFKVDPTHRVELLLEKNKVKEEKLKK